VPARREDGINAEAILEEGHETRDLGSVVLSRRAVNDLDLHRQDDTPRSLAITAHYTTTLRVGGPQPIPIPASHAVCAGLLLTRGRRQPTRSSPPPKRVTIASC
jgi:hypothetical protein